MAVKTGSSTASPVGLAFMGLGTMIQGQAKYDALMSQARAEMANAAFYRDQADFQEASGQRKEVLYHQESQIQFGEQESGFAKAGIDTENSSFFMATQMLKRQVGEEAIKTDTEMNVRLARARADAADQQARDERSAGSSEQMGTYIQTAAMVAMML